MAQLINRTIQKPVASFDGGEVRALLTGKKLYISTPALDGLTRKQMVDFKDAINLLARHIANALGKPVSLKGTKTDPDEPKLEPDSNLTVVYQIYPHDKTHKLAFIRYAENGKVLAYLKPMTFTDIPSLVQVGFISNLAADLMRRYEELS